MGHPQRAPLNFPLLWSGSGGGVGAGSAGQVQSAQTRRGCIPRVDERPQRGGGASEVRERARSRARGGGAKSASWKLTAVVGLVAVGVRLLFGWLGGRPRRAGARAGARARTVGSEELVDILVVVAGAVGGAAAARAGRGRGRGGVPGRSRAGPRGRG